MVERLDFPQALLIVGGFLQAVKDFRKDVLLHHLAVGRGVAQTVVVAVEPPDFVGVLAEREGDFLHDVLDVRHALGTAKAPEGGVGREVGLANRAPEAGIGQVVGVV